MNQAIRQPGVADVHVDSALSDFATRYENGEYFADQVSPIKETDKRSGKYFTFSRRDTAKQVDDLLSPQGGANEVGYTQGSANYSVEDRGLNGVIPAEVERNADAPLTPEEDETANVTDALMRQREIRVATLLTTQANFATGNYTTVSNYWSNTTAGTPLSDINTGRAALPPIRDSRTLLVMSLEVWNDLRVHPDMLSLRAGGGSARGQISRQEAAEYLNVDEVLVSESQKDTANEGATASYSRIWTTTKAVLVRVPQSVTSNRVHAFSVTFRTRPGMQVRTWRDEDRGKGGSTIVRVEFSDDEVVCQNDAAYLLQGVRAA